MKEAADKAIRLMLYQLGYIKQDNNTLTHTDSTDEYVIGFKVSDYGHSVVAVSFINDTPLRTLTSGKYTQGIHLRGIKEMHQELYERLIETINEDE